MSEIGLHQRLEKVKAELKKLAKYARLDAEEHWDTQKGYDQYGYEYLARALAYSVAVDMLEKALNDPDFEFQHYSPITGRWETYHDTPNSEITRDAFIKKEEKQ